MRVTAIKVGFQQFVQNHALAAKLMAVALLTVVGVGIYINQVGARAAGGDCSANSIIKCGISNYGDLTAKYDQNAHGDIRAIMDHYWIKRTPEAGNRVLEGVANNKGEVIADGRVVANNASSIGRQAIAHSRQISIAGRTYYETTHVNGLAFKPGTTQLPALVVLDGQGNFKYAILKACGNPIYARPVPPPTPPTPPTPTPPAPKKQLVRCDLLSVKKLERTKFIFSVNYTAENTEVKQVIFTVRDSSGKVITTQSSSSKTLTYTQETAGEYTVTATIKATVDGKEVTETSDACEKKFVVAEEDKEIVCEISTKNLNKTITKKEYEEDQKLEPAKRKYSKNQADCEEKPTPKENCEVPGKEHLPKDSPDCVEPTTPVELPKTGGTTIVSAVLGVTAMTVAAYYYLNSRRM